MNENPAPEDVEALCSRAHMDTAHYKVFQRPRRPMRNAAAPELRPEPSSADGLLAAAEEVFRPAPPPPPAVYPAAFSPILTPAAALPACAPPAPEATPFAAHFNPAAQVLSNPETAFLQNPPLNQKPAPPQAPAPWFGSSPASVFAPETAFAAPAPTSAPPYAPTQPFYSAAQAQFVMPQATPSTAPAYATYPAPATVPAPCPVPQPGSGVPLSEFRPAAGMTIPMETPGQAAESVRRRWAMLRGLSADDATDLQTGGGGPGRIPVFSIVGLAGGAGRTTAAATLTAVLSRMGERVLLVHGTADDMTPCHFGITSTRPGWARAVAPSHQGAGMVYLLACEESVEDSPSQASDWLSAQLGGLQGQLDRIIIQTHWKESRDAAFLALSNACIAMLTPDVKCLYHLTAFRRWLAARQQGLGQALPVGYLLNKFDPAVTFHADMQQWLRCELGNRLLSFTIRRTDAITEALGTGTTLIDYAPDSPAVNDFLRLASWTRDVGIRQSAAKG